MHLHASLPLPSSHRSHHAYLAHITHLHVHASVHTLNIHVHTSWMALHTHTSWMTHTHIQYTHASKHPVHLTQLYYVSCMCTPHSAYTAYHIVPHTLTCVSLHIYHTAIHIQHCICTHHTYTIAHTMPLYRTFTGSPLQPCIPVQ